MNEKGNILSEEYSAVAHKNDNKGNKNKRRQLVEEVKKVSKK